MHKIFPFVVLFFSLSSSAQKVIWSPPLSESSKMDYAKVIGQNDSGFYLVRSNHPVVSKDEVFTYRNNRFLVSFFDYEMRLMWEKSADVLKKDTRIICFVPSGNNLIELSAEWNKTEKKFRLLSRNYDLHGRADTSYTTVATEDINAVDNESSFFIASSTDKNSMVIAYRMETENNVQQYSVLLCDASFNVTKKSLLNVALPRKYFNPYRFLVSNSGNIFLFAVKTDEEKRSRDVDRNFFSVLIHTADDRWIESEIRSTQHYLTDAGIAYDEMNRKLVITGFYSDKTEYSTAGVFYYSQDPALQLSDSIHFSSFVPSFLYKFLGEKKENYNRELINYSIDKIILRRDGGAVIIAEANYTSDYSYYDYYLRTYISRKYYHRDNIIQLSVNKDGSIMWSNMVHKEQTADEDDNSFFSYTSAVAGGKFHCIYNRFLKRRTQVQQSSTDALGNEKSSVLFGEEQDVYIMPTAAAQVDADMLVIPAYKGKDFRLAGIVF
jgi:hypothetical protein